MTCNNKILTKPLNSSVTRVVFLFFLINVSYLHYANSHAGKRFGSRSPVMDVKEQKEEKLKKRPEAYKQNKAIKKKKKYTDLEPEVRKKLCAQKRKKYLNMLPDQKKARLEQVDATHHAKNPLRW